MFFTTDSLLNTHGEAVSNKPIMYKITKNGIVVISPKSENMKSRVRITKNSLN